MPASVQTMTNATVLPIIKVKVSGTDLTVEAANDLLDVEVNQSVVQPSMFILRFQDRKFSWSNSDTFAVGKAVTISVGESSESLANIMTGEITGIELQSHGNEAPIFTVRGYDKLYRLHMGRKTRTFLNQKNSDLVATISGEASLGASATDSGLVYPYILQNNETNLEFLRRRVAKDGMELFVDNGKLTTKKVPAASNPVATLKQHESLLDYTIRLSSANQVSSVVVKGWNVKEKAPIVGTSASATNSLSPSITYSKSGKQVGALLNSAAKMSGVFSPVENQTEAEKQAKAIFDDITGRYIQIEGTCYGLAAIKAGTWLEVKPSSVDSTEAASNFSGKYYINSCTHTYSRKGYYTSFEGTGNQTNSIFELAGGGAEQAGKIHGVVSGIVTKVKDPDNTSNKGVVKVKFPWMPNNGSDIESNWARVASPMTGGGRGMFFQHEVNDEVLVAFENGDVNHPYILGGLWNGVDAPPLENDDFIASDGKIDKRIIKTRIGHTITFNDSKDAPGISIVDKTTKNKITIDSKDNANLITIESDKDITLKATNGTITLDAKEILVKGSDGVKFSSQKNLEITATQNVKVSSTQDTSINATGNLKMAATQNAELKGTMGTKIAGLQVEIKGDTGTKIAGLMVDIAGSTMTKIDGGAMTKISGAMVMIN